MSKVVGFAYLSLLLLGWMDNIRSPFFPDVLETLHLTGTTGSLFFAATSVAAFFASWTGPYWLGRFTSIKLLEVTLAFTGVGFFLIGRSPNLTLLLASCSVFGFAYGLLSFTQNVVIQEYGPAPLRRRLYTGLHSMYGLAALLAPLSASLFISVGADWRRAFSVLSGLAILMAVIIRIGLSSTPGHRLVQSRAEPKIAIPSPVVLWLTGLAVSFYLFGELGVSTRLVLWLRTEKGFAPQLANWYLAAFFLALLAGRLVFTIVDLSHLSNRRILLASSLLSVVVISLGLLHNPVWLSLSGLTMAPFYPVSMNLLAELFGQNFAHRTLAFGISMGMLMTVALHFSLGILTDAFGLGRALWLAPSGLLLVAFFLQLANRVHVNELASSPEPAMIS